MLSYASEAVALPVELTRSARQVFKRTVDWRHSRQIRQTSWSIKLFRCRKLRKQDFDWPEACTNTCDCAIYFICPSELKDKFSIEPLDQKNKMSPRRGARRICAPVSLSAYKLPITITSSSEKFSHAHDACVQPVHTVQTCIFQLYISMTVA